MSSGNEEQIQMEKQSPKITRSSNLKTENNSIPKAKCHLPLFTFVVALAALGTAAYTMFLNERLEKQLADKNTYFSVQLTQLEQKQSNVQEQIDAKTNDTLTAQTQLQTKFDNLNKQLQNAMQQRFYQNQDWALLKARYYLELAQINAHWSDSIASVIALLEQADHLLQQFSDPKILDIRQAIAKDIAQIQALPHVDIAGILSQLDAAQNSINNLTIPLPANSTPVSENTSTSPNKESTWRLHLQSSMSVLEKFVVIRRHDQNVQPLLSPLLENILKENLHLSLQEAQWAVLTNNPSVYQLALKQAIQNLKMNFNENIAATAMLIKKLTELEQINIMQKRQEIGAVLPLLNELIDAKKAQLNQPISSKQGGNQ